MDKTAKTFPKTELMLCSGGGGRVDYGALKYFHEFWPSDNTDPVRRVTMQWDYSYFFPAMTLCSHVTHWGKRPMHFACAVAMSGRAEGSPPGTSAEAAEAAFVGNHGVDISSSSININASQFPGSGTAGEPLNILYGRTASTTA